MKKDELFTDVLVSASKKRFVGDVKPHGHDFFELEYIIEGKGAYEIDGKQYQIKSGMLFFMTPANVHTVKNADMELINVMFKVGGGALPFDLSGGYMSATEFSEQDRTLVFELLSELVKVHKTDVRYGRLLLECVFQKLSFTEARIKPEIKPYVSQTITFILENFRKGITLGDVARVVGLSKAYLSDYFVNHTGINFKTYLDNVRFDYVRMLLEFTDTPIGEIYLDAGFGDYTNFSRRFKKRFLMSPVEYRSRYRN